MLLERVRVFGRDKVRRDALRSPDTMRASAASARDGIASREARPKSRFRRVVCGGKGVKGDRRRRAKQFITYKHSPWPGCVNMMYFCRYTSDYTAIQQNCRYTPIIQLYTCIRPYTSSTLPTAPCVYYTAIHHLYIYSYTVLYIIQLYSHPSENLRL